MSRKYHNISLPWLSVSESFSIAIITEFITSAVQSDIPDQHQILDFSLLLCSALCNDNGLHTPFSFPLPLTICNLPWWVVFTKIAFWMQWTLKSISQQRQDILLQAVSPTDLHQPTSNRDNNVFKYKKRLGYFTHHKLFLTVAHPNKEA